MPQCHINLRQTTRVAAAWKCYLTFLAWYFLLLHEYIRYFAPSPLNTWFKVRRKSSASSHVVNFRAVVAFLTVCSWQFLTRKETRPFSRRRRPATSTGNSCLMDTWTSTLSPCTSCSVTLRRCLKSLRMPWGNGSSFYSGRHQPECSTCNLFACGPSGSRVLQCIWWFALAFCISLVYRVSQFTFWWVWDDIVFGLVYRVAYIPGIIVRTLLYGIRLLGGGCCVQSWCCQGVLWCSCVFGMPYPWVGGEGPANLLREIHVFYIGFMFGIMFFFCLMWKDCEYIDAP